MLTLHAAAASAAFQLATMPEYPSRHLAPNDVIEAFTSNLQASKHSHAFRWVSEHCRRRTPVACRACASAHSLEAFAIVVRLPLRVTSLAASPAAATK